MYALKIDGVFWPMPPSSINVKYPNRNETIELANGSEFNLRKTAGLIEVDMEVCLPFNKYPFLKTWKNPEYYIKKLREMKAKKKKVDVRIYRYGPKGYQGWNYRLSCTLEDFQYLQDASNGQDFAVTLTWKQWKTVGTKKVKITKKPSGTKITTKPTKPSSKVGGGTYTAKKGDCLSTIAKRKHVSRSALYKLNKKVIEAAAKKHGKKSSSMGAWIYPGTKLKIPKK